MSNPDDRIIGLDNNNGLSDPEVLASLAEFTGDVQATTAGTSETRARFKVKAPKPQEAVSPEAQAAADEDKKSLEQKVAEMDFLIQELVKGRDGVKLKASQIAKKAIDWNKITEKDIFDMEIPIAVVDHNLPDYIKIELNDSNWVPRWVQKLPRRLGPMKAMGFVFVEKPDIKGDITLDIDVDEQGHYRFDDVVLMKIEKRVYYGMLRKNHERAIAMTSFKGAHKAAQERIINDLQATPDGIATYEKYASKGQLEVFTPGV